MPETFTKRDVEMFTVVSRDMLARQTSSLQDDDATGIVIRERVAVIFIRRTDPAKARWRSWSRPGLPRHSVPGFARNTLPL